MAKPKKMTKKQKIMERNRKFIITGIFVFLIITVVALLLKRPSLFQVVMIGGCVGGLGLGYYLKKKFIERRTSRRKA